jgi:hypothetical protein
MISNVSEIRKCKKKKIEIIIDLKKKKMERWSLYTCVGCVDEVGIERGQ